MILFLLQIYFNIFKKVFPLKNTIKRTFSALSRTSFSHCGKISPKLKDHKSRSSAGLICLYMARPASHSLLHAFHIQHAQRKAFSDQFNRNVFVVFFKVWNFVGIDELKGIEVLFCLFRP